jgi:hypothetical protein
MDKNILTIHDIAPPVESLPATPVWPWFILAAAVLLAVLLVRHLRYRQPPTPAAAPEPPTLSPMQIALNELDRLMNKKLIENDRSSIFFTELNMILRRFLKNTFPENGLPPTASSSSEILPIITKLNKPQLNTIFKSFLQDCDVFKFADITAQPDIARKAADTCRKLIIEIAAATGDNDHAV